MARRLKLYFCEPCERFGNRFRSFHKPFERFSYMYMYPLAILTNPFAKFTNLFEQLGNPF